MVKALRQTASILFVNPRGEVLLQLRDDIPKIRYPNHWGLIGGHAEPGETIEQTLVRETEEEVGEILTDYAFFGTYQSPPEGDSAVEVHVYVATLDKPAESLPLTEGQRVEFVTPEVAVGLPLVPWLAQLLPDFFTSPVYQSLLAART